MNGLGGSVPAFDKLLRDEYPKDTLVIVVEEGADSPAAADQRGAGHKRRRADQSPGSMTVEAQWVVLHSLSPYFDAKPKRCGPDDHPCKKQCSEPVNTRQSARARQNQGATPTYQYSVQLLVPRGQLELGRRLITCMYSSSPDLSDLGNRQLMQLAALAERYGVGKVIEAVAAQLQQLRVDTMPLGTAAAVFELPEACLGLAVFKAVQKTAASTLQQQLGDLEVVWGSAAKQQALLDLPFEALLRLLTDERTRVSSEDTVVAIASAWLDYNYHQQCKAQQLLAAMRLPHCSGTYLTSGAVRGDLLTWGLDDSKGELSDLHDLATGCDSSRQFWLADHHLSRNAWRLPRRPASSITQLEVAWQLPVSDLKATYERAASDPESRLLLRGPRRSWLGRHWNTGAYVTGGGGFGLYIATDMKARVVRGQLRMETTTSGPLRWDLSQHTMSETRRYYSLYSAPEGGTSMPWAGLLVRLAALPGLIHGGDNLHISYTVEEVV